MPDPVLVPNQPADHAPIVAAGLRGQFQAIADKIDDLIVAHSAI